MKILTRLSLLILGVFAVLYAVASCGGGGGGGAVNVPASTAQTFTANLTLQQEVPTPTTPAGATPSGSGSVTLDPVTKVLTGSFTTTNVVSAVNAHIHDGDIGVAGPIIVPLTQNPAGSGIWEVPAGITLTDSQIAELRAGGYYVNVHTTLNPSGEIRAQLIPPGSAATVFNASLTLAQEEPTPTTPAGATPSGTGSVTLDPVTKVLTGSFTTTNVVSAVNAHIHDGDIGVAGPIIVPLTQNPAGSGIWVVPAGITLTDSQIAELRAGGYYVNVHTTLNPSGEIRSQLIPVP
jgi:ABC-type phosphate transport system substrate-binding protein